MKNAQPFDAQSAEIWKIFRNVDPSILRAGTRATLEAGRLKVQTELLRVNFDSNPLLCAGRNGAIADGHHRARAAAELGRFVDVMIVDFEIAPGAQILDLPVL